MFIPLRTDRPPRHKPVITQALIAVNVLIYLAGQIGKATGRADLDVFISWFHFDPQHFRAWQLITYQFMHDLSGPWHIVFNMLFLWVFGGPVEDRLGAFGFAAFYLIGGMAAAGGHMLVESSPVIGASGSVAACTGAFLALFPRSRILIFFLLGGGYLYVSSLWFIGFYFVIDVMRQTIGFLGYSGDVAYMAHIAGYLYGFGVAFGLLAARALKREEYDVFFLFTQARRRAALRAANRANAAGVWDSATADTGARLAQRAARAEPLDPQQSREMELRAEVNRLAAGHDLSAAAAKYRALLDEFPQSVLSQDRQLEVANQLCAQQDHAHAAIAYELLLERYPNLSSAAEVQLILAVLYARQLHRPEAARKWIDLVRPKLSHDRQIALAEALRSELSPAAAPATP